MTKEEIPLGLRFAIISRSFKCIMDEHLRELELTGVQFGVLSAILKLEHDGVAEINQRELERLSHVTHPTMTEILKRLEKKGYIICTRSSTDRRSKCIRSAQRARAVRSEVSAAKAQANVLLFKDVSEAELDSLTAITDKILENAFALKGENRD